MKLRQRGNPNKNQKDYICNIPVRPKKRGGGGVDIFWFPCAFQLPHLTHPPPPHISQFPLFSLWPVTLILVPLLFLFFNQHNTHTHTPLPHPPTGTFLIITSTIFLAKSLENPQEHHTFT